MGLWDSAPDEKHQIIERLTLGLAEAHEANRQLRESNRAAVGARKGAVERVRELEDVLRLKERMAEDQDRQMEGLQQTNESLRSQLQAVERQLAAFRQEQASFPLSDMDLLHRYQRQHALFELIEEAVTCPICYSPFAGKGGGQMPISLWCGHSFCVSCFEQWEAKHLNAFKLSNQQGAYSGADCPECRSAAVRKGKVRIWALEEVIRLVERGTKEAEIPYTPATPATAAAAATVRSAASPPTSYTPPPPPPPSEPSLPPPPLEEPVIVEDPGARQYESDFIVVDEDIIATSAADDVAVVEAEVGEEVDESAMSFLRPRRSTPYGQVLR